MSFINEGGRTDWPWYWTSTTQASYNGNGSGVYVAFGRAVGWQKATPSATCYTLYDVHGAGAQRSDPKTSSGIVTIGLRAAAARLMASARRVMCSVRPTTFAWCVMSLYQTIRSTCRSSLSSNPESHLKHLLTTSEQLPGILFSNLTHGGCLMKPKLLITRSERSRSIVSGAAAQPLQPSSLWRSLCRSMTTEAQPLMLLQHRLPRQKPRLYRNRLRP